MLEKLKNKDGVTLVEIIVVLGTLFGLYLVFANIIIPFIQIYL